MTARPLPTAAHPPDYPGHLERWLVVADGRRIFVRPIVPDDVARLRFELDRLDPESLYQRFFTFSPQLNDDKLRYLAEVDYRHRLALVALDEDGEGQAVVRYEGSPERPDAEVAFTVKPAWRRVGLASIMLAMLEGEAVAHGIERFTAVYLADNHAAAGVLERAGFDAPHVADGLAETQKELRTGDQEDAEQKA